MNIFKKILSSGVKEISDGVSGVIDSITAPGMNKEALKVQVQQIVAAGEERILLDLQANDKEVSERHKNDMASDSWLSKNVRPMLLIFLTVFTIVLAYLCIFILSKEDVDVMEPWIDLLQILDVTAYTFYFGSRGAEKIIRGKKNAS